MRRMREELESEVCLACRRGEMYHSCVGDSDPESEDIFSDVCVNRINQYQPPPCQEDVIQAARKMLAQVLVWIFTYFQIKSESQNNASLWGVPEVATEIFVIMEETSASVVSELGASWTACDALLNHGFPSHLLWSCVSAFLSSWRTNQKKWWEQGTKAGWTGAI